MLALSNLQQQFVDGLRNQSIDIMNSIQPNANLSAASQFQIYQDNTRSKLQRALIDIYPVCHQLVGQDFFVYMANCYVDQTPSYVHDLHDYSETFATFIRTYSPAETVPYLADVARLEWAWHRISRAPANHTFDFKKFAACYATAGQNMIFLLPPQSSLIASPYPIHRIWEVNQNDYAGNTHVTLESNQMYYFIIWRKQFELRLDALPSTTWNILSWIQTGQSLKSVCEKTASTFPQLNIATLLPEWITCGWIEDFKDTS